MYAACACVYVMSAGICVCMLQTVMGDVLSIDSNMYESMELNTNSENLSAHCKNMCNTLFFLLRNKVMSTFLDL